jgi:hypothetical protein
MLDKTAKSQVVSFDLSLFWRPPVLLARLGAGFVGDVLMTKTAPVWRGISTCYEQ